MKNVRILTKSEQRQTIMGAQKSKKPTIKTYIESPFVLEWPKLTPEAEKEITTLLQKSCLGLQKFDRKPPWKQVSKYKGAERKEFLQLHYKKFQESLDPENIKKNKQREEALSSLIFGYNAVMRAMEQDRVAGILLKKNVKPDFVTKAFLPGCANKCIPVVPLSDLEKVLQDKDTLAIPHACMVLGLKPSVKDESNIFYPLFAKMCEALLVEECEEDSSENEEDCTEIPATNGEEKGNPKRLNLSEVDISSYHLKRNGTKGRRAFVPGTNALQKNESHQSDDFMSLGLMQNHQEGNKVQSITTKSERETENKSENLKTSLIIDENTDLSSMIIVDASGDENPLVGSSLVKHRPPDAEKPAKNNGKAKQKRKEMDSSSYVPAKTKLIKGNPNRKGKVM